MSISFEDNLAEWIAIEERARRGAEAAADAMARYIAWRTAEDTLRRRRTSPGQYYKAVRGEPPAYGSGKLAESMYWEPASRGLRASAIAGSRDKRAALFEFGGCVHKPTSRSVMHWVDSGGSWYHAELRVDTEHPFLSLTTEEAIDDGELQRVAVEAFREYDP